MVYTGKLNCSVPKTIQVYLKNVRIPVFKYHTHIRILTHATHHTYTHTTHTHTPHKKPTHTYTQHTHTTHTHKNTHPHIHTHHTQIPSPRSQVPPIGIVIEGKVRTYNATHNTEYDAPLGVRY